LLATILVFASFLLMSPPRGETYPGAKPWGTFSLLKPVTDLMSLYGLLATERGVEVKDFAFHLAAAAGLGLLALRVATGTRVAGVRAATGANKANGSGSLWPRRLMSEPWLAAQLLLVGWVVISALSAFWSGDAALSRGQAVLYGLALAWAIALAWTLEPQDVPKLLAALVAASTVGAVLCIWYYYERNPYHRPGFPLGNPITLSAAMLPGILICVSVVIAAVEGLFTGCAVVAPRVAFAAAAALIPLVWCFLLADSRSAGLGLAGGIMAIALLRVGPRLRWAVIGVALTAGLAIAMSLMQYSRLDAAMGRSATIRFRLYAWRYAAKLWDHNWLTAVAGNGAGSYPRLAAQHSVQDRRFDPNAFMGDMVEHAHNELFEVLSEIGLVGGVTFVGGLLGTLVAGGLLLRRRLRPGEQWLYTGLLAGIVALMIDGCFSSGLRLPGLPAIFFTLLGIVWALCRTTAAPMGPVSGRSWGIAPAFGVGVLALGALYFALQNWSGVLHEERGRQAALLERHDEAYQHRMTAEGRVLDPVRMLIDDARAGQALLNGAVALARESVRSEGRACDAGGAMSSTSAGPVAGGAAAGSGPALLEASALSSGTRGGVSSGGTQATATSPALSPLRKAAVERGLAAYEHAVRLGRRAPTILGAANMEAGAAQLLAELHADLDPEQAGEWTRRAVQAWLTQRKYRPYDFEALLMLTTYRWPPAEGLRLLCDALRAPDAHTLAGQPLSFEQTRNGWRDALARLAAQDGFDVALEHALAVVGPLDPQTDIDTLINSRAPEVYRVAAYVAAQQGDFAAAQKCAARALTLYEAMHGRFPSLSSVTLLEQAEFALVEGPANAARAADLLNQAISRLPVIQEQKQAALLQPYRSLLVLALLAQGLETEAAALLQGPDEGQLSAALADSYVELARIYIRQPRERRPDVESWLTAALRHRPDHVFGWSWRAWLAGEAGDRGRVGAVLKAAQEAGVSAADVSVIRNSLCREFPGFCGADASNPLTPIPGAKP
jgi:tetratricopeptide (TPR) repeat protein